MRENTLNGYDETTTRISVEEYRSRIVSCRTCPSQQNGGRVIHTPRFGLGKMDSPKLAVLGEQPNRDPDKCWHSAFGLHYRGHNAFDGKFSFEDDMVANVLSLLDLNPRDVWATNACKCPIAFDGRADRFTIDRCVRRHLKRELFTVRPKIVLLFGWSAAMAYNGSYMSYPAIGDQRYKIKRIDPYGHSRIRTFGNVVEVDTINVYGDLHRWCEAVADAVEEAYNSCYGEVW